MKRFILQGLVIVLLIAACSPASANQSPPTPDPTLMAHGIEVYRNSYCGTCHILEDANTRGIFGPAHDDMVTVATERIANERYAGTATSIEAYLRESILDPQSYVVEGYETTSHSMPAYTHLETTDIDAIIYLLMHQQ